MSKRNIWGELEAMGFEADDQQYQEAERRDAQHQEQKCRQLYLKDAQDFFAWKRANAPKDKKPETK